MKTQYWLVKQEPESYAWDTFVKDGRTSWDGVRNYQARNNLRLMRPGDRVLFYASGGPKEVVGTARVSRAAYPDPTADDPAWISVEIEAEAALRKPVPLPAIRSAPGLSGVPLLRHTRLSVMPLSRQEFEGIVALGS
jgi:predicted RNA-binding protein with PUA-like domain